MKSAVLALTLIAAAVTAPLYAQDTRSARGLQMPITGTTAAGDVFSGTFTLQRFATDGGKVVAVGTVAGSVTNAAGQVVATGLRTVSLPTTISQAPAAATAATPTAAATSCGILHLDLGPLSLDLLGLQVNLSRVVLDISAVPGAGNLLGNLLCSVVNLLNDPAGLAQLLNQILGILTSL
jgi:hypothetical protein